MKMKNLFNMYLSIIIAAAMIVLCITSLIITPNGWVGTMNIILSILDIVLCVIFAVDIIIAITVIVKAKRKN